MHVSKITRKGQITLPYDIRKKLNLGAGSVVVIDISRDRILVKKPKTGLEKLYGAWSDMTDEEAARLRKLSREWNEKSLAGF